MGRNTPEFISLARELVEKHAAPVDDEAVRTSPSSNDRFISVTVTITAKSQEQLDAIYQDATDNEDVLMAL